MAVVADPEVPPDLRAAMEIKIDQIKRDMPNMNGFVRLFWPLCYALSLKQM